MAKLKLVAVIGLLAIGLTACGADVHAVIATPTATQVPSLFDPGEGAGLLSANQVQAWTAQPVELVDVLDVRAMAEAVDPVHVINIKAWFAASYQMVGEEQSVSLSVMEFSASDHAWEHFLGRVQDGLLQPMDDRIGEGSAVASVDANGIGSMVVFIVSAKVVTLHSTMLVGQPNTLIGLESLQELARLVASLL
jgi:hypothetical protein